MNTTLLDAVSILPRIELLNGYLEEEINQLERYLHKTNAPEFLLYQCNKIKQLVLFSADISEQLSQDVNFVMEDKEDD